MSWGTVTIIEVIWTAVAGIGLAVSIWALNDAVATLRYLEARSINGARHLTARANTRNEVIRTLIHGMYLILGIIALAAPPANPAHPISATSVIIGVGLITTVTLLITKTIWSRHDRQRVIELLSKSEDRS
jgi:hypothetical protein